jgi:hypothetical protein
MAFINTIKSAEDIINLINQIEIDLTPQNWKINDIDVWPVLRNALYYELSISLINKESKIRSNYLQLIKRTSKSFFSSFNKINPTGSILLVSDGISYIEMGTSFYDRFCDPVIEILDTQNTAWDKWDIAENLITEKTYPSNNINSNLDLLILKSKFYNCELITNRDSLLEDLCNYVNKHTKTVLWKKEAIRIKIMSIVLMIDWYKTILKNKSVRLAMLVSYYSDRGMALLKACHDLNIVTADIQHGVQGNLHGAYGRWTKVPEYGYNTLPNSFLVWSKKEKDNIESSFYYPNKKHHAVVIGNLFKEKWHNDEIEFYDIKTIKLIKKFAPNKTILFTVQYGVTYNQELFKLIFNTQHQLNWLIRFHPIMDKTQIKSFRNILYKNDITVFESEKASSLPLYALLRHVNIHITHSSSTVLEALSFNVPSLLIDKFGLEYYKDYIGQMVQFSSDIKEQIQFINEMITNSYYISKKNKLLKGSRTFIQQYLNQFHDNYS